jgi:hypothetical protein
MILEEWQFDLIEKEHKGDVLIIRKQGLPKIPPVFVRINNKMYMTVPQTLILEHTNRLGKGITDILSMDLVGAEQDLFNYIQENVDGTIDFDIIHWMVVYPLKMRITSFIFQKGFVPYCKLEGIVF